MIFLRSYSTGAGILFVIFIVTVGISFTTIAYQNLLTRYDTLVINSELAFAIERNILKNSTYASARKKPDKVEARGIYLTAYTANSSNLSSFIERIRNTELNAVVIDIKDYSGWIAYDTDVDLINELGTEKIIINDIEDILTKLHRNGIYAIARLQVFQDPVLAEKKPDWAIYNSVTKSVWKDYKGLAWMDPHNEKVWEYTVSLAKDAIAKGFDEINFDYIRFPSDGPIGNAVYANDEGRTKTETMNVFFAYLAEQLKDEPAYLSADLFGMTMWHTSDFNIGQTLVGAAPHFDYIAPMVYPSHYPNNFLGLANPAAHPYTVIEANLARGKTFLETVPTSTARIAQIRPWLQDFDLGAVYTAEMVRDQIRAAEEHDTHGWMLWNASNRYTYEALLTSE